MGNLVQLVTFGLFIYGAVAVASAATVIVKGYYAMKILRETTRLLKELTEEVKSLRSGA